jgi:hypothetical protein
LGAEGARYETDDELRAQLAALDELLRQPEEPARAPRAPADFTVAEPVELVGPSRDRVKPSPSPGPAPVAGPAPGPASAPPSVARAKPPVDRAPPSVARAKPPVDRTPPPVDRAKPSSKRTAPSLERIKPSRDLALPSRATNVMRTEAAAIPALRSRPRFRVAALWVGALSVGLAAGGLLGWWHAVNPPIDTPGVESAAPAPPAAVPAGKARGPSRSTRGAAPPRSAPAPARATTPSSALPSAALPPSVGAPSVGASSVPAPSVPAPSVALPPAAATTTSDAGAIVGAIPAAPSPAIELPLAAAPLPVAPSMTPMPSAAPPAVAAAGGVAAAMVAADEAAIEKTLQRYEDAYDRLDAKAAVAVWPSVDQRALSRAFAGLASQTLNFRGCEVNVRAGASTATASCSGTAEYVRKVGDTRVRVEPRQWTFTLNKTQGAWRIEAVDGSR